MKDKEIRKLLKSAYAVTPSPREKAFLRRYEKRSLCLSAVCGRELKYMGLMSVLSGIILLTVSILTLKTASDRLIWCVSSCLPVMGLMLLCGLGRSERCGMQELEAASRFSLRFIRMVRMSILGTVTLVILTAASLLLHKSSDLQLLTVLGCLGTPYMLCVWGNLMITRRWHDKENLLGCLGVTALACILPALLEKAVYLKNMEPLLFPAVLLLLCVLTVRESILYLKESEDLSWNFC